MPKQLNRRHFLAGSALAGAGAALAAAVPGSATAPSGSTAASRQRSTSCPLYGFHQDLHYYNESAPPRVDAVASIGATVSRSTLQWLRNEPEPGQFNWTGSDIIYDSLQTAGIVPLWFVGRSPSWANGSDNGWVVPPYPSAAFDKWSDGVANWAGLAAQRYPGCLWEVWNEPNEAHFWIPTPDPEAYSVLYNKVRPAILAGDPQANVALGGITGLLASGGWAGRGIEFIRQLLINGDPIDHVGIHPYGRAQPVDECLAGEQSFRDAADVRRMLTEHGNFSDLWITEWGQNLGNPWQSGGEAEQARYLWRGQQLMRDGFLEPCEGDPAPVELDVTVSTFFFDIDTANFPNHGVFTEDLQPRLAARLFRAFMKTVRC